MTTYTATDAKNRFGELLDAANREPIEIDKKGRPVAVIVSFDAYQEMQERLGNTFSETSFEFLRRWRIVADKSRKESSSSAEDYQKHLDEKYGR